MAALFPPSATRNARAALAAALALVVLVPVLGMVWVRTSWARGEHVRITQPVPFDHRIHVTGLRIDCRYCHAEVERSAWAGLPSTQQCVSCHTQLWMSLPPFAAVRQSVSSGRPIPWRRVTQLPAFVYFDHAIHVTKGVGCETCHGRVNAMRQVRQATPLTMAWCLDCHRNPAPRLRPVEQVTTMNWTPPATGAVSGPALATRYHVRRLTNCTTCHR